MLQCKLAIGSANDPLEAEADHMADQVIRGTARSPQLHSSAAKPALRRKCACQGSGSECRECADEKEKKLQRKAQSAAVPAVAPAIVYEVLRSPGQALDPATREFFEPRFGLDLSHVRIHTDNLAHQSAQEIGAHAYTVGTRIAFAQNRFAPGTAEGRRLLAHELAHVLQRRDHPFPRKLHRQSSDVLEESGPVVDQKKCIARLGGCPGGDRSGASPSCEEIAGYKRECRAETHYTGHDVNADCPNGFIPDCPAPAPQDQILHELTPLETPQQLQPKPPQPCTTSFTKASSFNEFIDLIRAAETRLDAAGVTSPKDQIHALRGIYYGTEWSLDYTGGFGEKGEHSTTRNEGFQRFTRPSQSPDQTVPMDVRGILTCGLFDALKASQDVGDGKRKVDMGHVIIGLDARYDPDLSKNVSYSYHMFPVPMGGTGTEIVTWAGDLGGGTGRVALDRAASPTTPLDNAFNAPSDYGGTINLEGDIAGVVGVSSSTTAITAPAIPAGKKLSDVLTDYFSASATDPVWKTRAQTFLTMYGGRFDASGSLTNRAALIAVFADKIQTFACNYLASRVGDKKASLSAAKKASDYVIPVSQEISEVFVNALERTARTGEKIEAKPPWPAQKATQSSCTTQIGAARVLDLLP